jgi:SAM-dependent methyltransferase
MVDRRSSGSIKVNTIGHQAMLPFASFGASYSLIHLLEESAAARSFEDVLIIGAGSGNDIAHAEQFPVARIDTVEIDPVIQAIGKRYHPDHPYEDPRVVANLDDGRHYLRTTDHKYDLVVYGLVDSLILHSGYSNLRLESFLFTKQAFEDVRRVLKPGGSFVIYNFMRQGWIVERIAAMAETVFGCPPLTFSLPYREVLKSSDPAGFTILIAGCNRQITEAFAKHGSFWLDTVPPHNLGVNGFTLDPRMMTGEGQALYQRIAPTRLVHDEGRVLTTSDDWPFLYLRGRFIPDMTLRSILLLGGLGLGMVYLFMPKRQFVFNSRMFFLGAAFMLVETKAVVQMALLFGSTWLVNAGVFATILIMILLANVYVSQVRNLHLWRHYVALFVMLTAGAFVSLDAFLGGEVLWRYAAPLTLTLGPMFFAAVIFGGSFASTADPDRAFGANIAGAVVGGFSESLSAVLGFRYLLLVAIAFYLLSIFSRHSAAAVGRIFPE